MDGIETTTNRLKQRSALILQEVFNLAQHLASFLATFDAHLTKCLYLKKGSKFNENGWRWPAGDEHV